MTVGSVLGLVGNIGALLSLREGFPFSWFQGLGAGMVMLILLAACSPPPEEAREVRPVRVEKTVLRRLERETHYAGAIQARYETQLAFRVGGKVIARRVEVGSTVEDGDELMRLDPGNLELVVQSLKAQLAAAEAELDQARAELNRSRDLLRRKLISSSEYERQETLYDTAQARYQQVKSQLEEAELQSGYTILKADRAGVITDVLVEVGQVVAAGQPVLNLAVLEGKDVIIHIPENRLNEFKQADQVRIVLWAAPEREYRGRVREISPVADPVTRTYEAKISVLNPDEAMHLGMTAKVQVRQELSKPAIHLPLTALFEKDGQAAVWVVDPARLTVDLAPVTLGEIRDNQVTLSGGLGEGLLVVTAGVHKLHPGQKVRLLEDKL